MTIKAEKKKSNTRVIGFQSDVTERLYLLESQMESMTSKLDKFVGNTAFRFT